MLGYSVKLISIKEELSVFCVSLETALNYVFKTLQTKTSVLSVYIYSVVSVNTYNLLYRIINFNAF